jgi:hypothetical protein
MILLKKIELGDTFLVQFKVTPQKKDLAVLFFFNDTHKNKFKANLEDGMNNFIKLLALKILSRLVAQPGI